MEMALYSVDKEIEVLDFTSARFPFRIAVNTGPKKALGIGLMGEIIEVTIEYQDYTALSISKA
jgi:hypothetical protein